MGPTRWSSRRPSRSGSNPAIRAPAWKRPEYGGLFWLNRIGTWDLPSDTYFAAGAGGQNTWIVPSLDLVIVRMGHMRGQGPARRATNAALGLVMEAVGSSAASDSSDPGAARLSLTAGGEGR